MLGFEFVYLDVSLWVYSITLYVDLSIKIVTAVINVATASI